jgi:hypothetical protein
MNPPHSGGTGMRGGLVIRPLWLIYQGGVRDASARTRLVTVVIRLVGAIHRYLDVIGLFLC